jgi:phosphoglycerate dehydrogenase-like enzyme
MNRPVIFFEPMLPDNLRDLVADVEVIGPDLADLERAEGAVIGAVRRWDRTVYALAPRLRVVSRSGIGYDNVDVADAAMFDVKVCNAPDAPTVSTAEHTVALIMAITKEIPGQQAISRRGERAGPATALELEGATLGLVGLGRIGRRVATAMQALGMRVIAHDPFLTSGPPGVELVADLGDVFAESDVLSLHAPATPETYQLINATTLAEMKPGAYLVNCARGTLVDHDALLAALDRGQLAGAGLDVTDPEPLPAGHPLLGHPRCVVTPHCASSTSAGRRRLFEHAIANALAVLRGEPCGSVIPVPSS